MKILDRERLDRFCRKHSDARAWIENWLADVESAAWATPQDIRRRYASASFLPGNVVVFNVKGNSYRLISKIYYPTQVVLIRFVLTHLDYDRGGWKNDCEC